jgi:hypothetical protein
MIAAMAVKARERPAHLAASGRFGDGGVVTVDVIAIDRASPDPIGCFDEPIGEDNNDDK